MTDAELRPFAEIELRLAVESPELRRLFDGAAPESRRRRRRAWWTAGVLTAVVSLVLLGDLLLGRRTSRHDSGRNR